MDTRIKPVDAYVALACAAGGAVVVFLRVDAGVGWVPPWVEFAAQGATALVVLVRRSHPLVLLACCLVAALVTPVVAALVAMHAVGCYVGSATVGLFAALAAVVITLPAWLLSDVKTDSAGLWSTILELLFFYAAGRFQRKQRRSAERAAKAAVLAARVAEREALAREVHDVVAQRISFTVIEAEIIDTETHDENVHGLARQIAETGRAALSELRTMLLALTSASPIVAATVSATGLADLVRDAGLVGQPVVLDQRVATSDPPDLVDRTVERVVREGLTNAVRHAPGAPTRVVVEQLDGGVGVTVENDAPASPPSGHTTGGFGLTGLRERVGLLGGTFESGPTSGGGFRLWARLPRKGA
ncbi:histidine kinase [Microbacterium sp. BWT-B31]|uniref:sensor histidine kinase n=1 Tax=Microbacterium sp. BWT-B31 TaxID=3232072 RepID=UPI003527B7D9